MEIYDCKLLFQKLLRRCEKELAQIGMRVGTELHLGIITVTTEEQNVAFASKVQSLAANLGLKVEDERIAARNIGRKFIPLLRDWSKDEGIHGIILLYKPGDNTPSLSQVYDILPWHKDAYGEHFHNVGHFCLEPDAHPGYPQPAEPAAVVEIITHYQIPVQEKRVVIIGDGGSFERVLMQKLCNLGCDVSFRRAEELTESIQSAAGHPSKVKTPVINRGGEIVVSCVNTPGYLSRSRIIRGSIIIDNGYNFYRGRIGGDVDFGSTQNWAKAITPVPGGVKSIAQVVTLLNFTRLVKRRYGLTEEDKKKDQITRRFHQVDKKLEANRSRI